MNRVFKRWIPVALLAALAGCASSSQPKDFVEVRYAENQKLIPMQIVPLGGDFALFLAGGDKPEVPVRVNAGDSIGFLKETDGRLKAVAGPFRMDLKPTVHEAFWKRLNYAE